MKIKKGDKFLCIRNVRMKNDNILVYSEGEVYKSEVDKCITNDEGDRNHQWEDVIYTERYFKKLD